MATKRIRLAFEQLETRQLLSGGAVTAAATTVFVHIPDNLTGQPGAHVAAPVQIDNAAGVRAAVIRINYDTALLDASDASVEAGALWPQGGSTQVVANVDDAAGTIVVSVATAEGLATGGGNLLVVNFTIAGGATIGSSTVVDLAGVRLNEGAIVPSPAPQPGPDSTDGRITFTRATSTASVAGVVYADTNGNNQPDAAEAIPRVKVVLVNASSGQHRETFTADDGSYLFDGLDAGSYRIQETQPAAFLNGGPNTISLDLADGESLTDQNFRERGLRPEFVYNQLFTTTALPVGSTNWVSVIRSIVAQGEAHVATGSLNAATQTAVRHVTQSVVAHTSTAKALITKPAAAKVVASRVISTSQAAYLISDHVAQTKRTKAADLIFANHGLRMFMS